MITFEGLTKEEFIEYFNDNDTLEFNNFYECAYENGDVSVWNIYDHNNISCYNIDEFFEMYGDNEENLSKEQYLNEINNSVIWIMSCENLSDEVVTELLKIRDNVNGLKEII